MSNVTAFLMLIALFASIPIIAVLDSALFGRWFRCDKCGHEYGMQLWFLPTALEVLLFMGGIALGLLL